MHAEIGHERARTCVIGLALREQRGAELRARQLHDIEARLPQRNADHLESARAEWLGYRDRRARIFRAEDRIRGTVTPGDPALLLVVVFAVDLVAALDSPQPIEHGEVVSG